jgi:LPXTG-motif cell wall-anchored protein
MKKSLLTIIIAIAFAIWGMLPVCAQEQPEVQKDSVNMDTEAKPTQYYDVEDDKTEAGGESKSSAIPVIGIVCAVLIIGSVVYFISKKRKK